MVFRKEEFDPWALVSHKGKLVGTEKKKKNLPYEGKKGKGDI